MKDRLKMFPNQEEALAVIPLSRHCSISGELFDTLGLSRGSLKNAYILQERKLKIQVALSCIISATRFKYFAGPIYSAPYVKPVALSIVSNIS